MSNVLVTALPPDNPSGNNVNHTNTQKHPSIMATPQKRNTNRGRKVDKKLSKALSAQLFIDFERHNKDTWQEFQRRELREEYKPGGIFTEACRNRFYHIKKLRKQQPDQYWKQYSKVTGGEYRDPNNSESESDEFSEVGDTLDEEFEIDVEEDEDDVTGNGFASGFKPTPVRGHSKSSFKSPPSSKNRTAKETPKSSKKGTPRSKQKEGPPSEIRSKSRASVKSPPLSSPRTFSSPSATMASTASSSKGGATNKAELWETLDDAKDEVNFVIEVDFDTPEANGGPMFFVQATGQIDIGKEIITEVRFYLNSLVDLRDFDFTKGKVVCQGRAFLITIPAIPFYRRTSKEVKEFFNNHESVRCPNTENNYVTEINDIAKDMDRLLVQYLFVMPHGTIISANLNSDFQPTADQKCKLLLRKQKLDFETGKEGKKKKRNQEQNFGFWVTRMIKAKRDMLSDEEADSDSDLEGAFAGMKV